MWWLRQKNVDTHLVWSAGKSWKERAEHGAGAVPPQPFAGAVPAGQMKGSGRKVTSGTPDASSQSRTGFALSPPYLAQCSSVKPCGPGISWAFGLSASTAFTKSSCPSIAAA
jgi:hypothetical protein